MNFLEIVNKVLRRLRLDPVSSVENGHYARLVSDLVNQTKREVEDSWNWSSLRTSLTIETQADVFSYQLDGAGERARLLFNERRQPSAWNVSVGGSRLNGPVRAEWITQKLISDRSTGIPYYFDINGESNNLPLLNLYPIPDKAYVLQFDLVVPQGDLVNNLDELLVPSWPVILGAHALAISERGEDGGISLDEADRKYHAALSDAIQLDRSNLFDDLIVEVV